MSYDLKDLKLVLMIAELGSLKKAAKESNLSPASASVRIAKLETELGAKLFIRHRRGLIPTTAGKISLQHIRNVFSIIRKLDEALY